MGSCDLLKDERSTFENKNSAFLEAERTKQTRRRACSTRLKLMAAWLLSAVAILILFNRRHAAPSAFDQQDIVLLGILSPMKSQTSLCRC